MVWQEPARRGPFSQRGTYVARTSRPEGRGGRRPCFSMSRAEDSLQGRSCPELPHQAGVSGRGGSRCPFLSWGCGPAALLRPRASDASPQGFLRHGTRLWSSASKMPEVPRAPRAEPHVLPARLLPWEPEEDHIFCSENSVWGLRSWSGDTELALNLVGQTGILGRHPRRWLLPETSSPGTDFPSRDPAWG